MPRPTHILTTLCIVLLLAACGSPDRETATAEPSAEPADQAADLSPDEPAAAGGEGTLRLGDTTYDFTIRVCDLSGEADTDYQTLVGRGTTPEGETFDVFVSRNDIGGILTHTVSFQTGDVRSGEGTVLEAQRMRQGGSWMSVRGGGAEPLIRIDGNRLTASGRFGPTEGLADEEEVDGEIEATCS